MARQAQATTPALGHRHPIIGPTLLELMDSYRLYLRASRKSAKTITAYLSVLETLTHFLTSRGMPTIITAITREHLQEFIADQLERLAPGTAAARYGWLKAFWAWAIDAGEITDSPMERMKQPPAPEGAVDVPALEDLRKILKACSGRDFYSRRDFAVLYVLLDTGLRRSEIAGMVWSDVDTEHGNIIVRGKRTRGRDRTRSVHLGLAAQSALDAYKRVRLRHKYAALPNVWLGRAGALTHQGIYEIVRDRSHSVGLALHPHQFRHYFANAWLESGGSEGGLRALAGWRSNAMLRYIKALATERALNEHASNSPGDHL